jgi:hypothetical protein
MRTRQIEMFVSGMHSTKIVELPKGLEMYKKVLIN